MDAMHVEAFILVKIMAFAIFQTVSVNVKTVIMEGLVSHALLSVY